MLNEINKQLDTLFHAYEKNSGTNICTHIYLDGTPMNLIFIKEDGKFSRLVTTPDFSEWMANCTGDYKKATPQIKRLAALYGVEFDSENGSLFLRFRRNEMTIAQAVMRMVQAIYLVCGLGPV
ncbi:MAG: hypothetical protein IJN65_03130 [Clostridia bacterium]|nr:hypothetical protein [Clostridia bacterium]